jgi:hypothetical protein
MNLKLDLHTTFRSGKFVIRAYAEDVGLDPIAEESFSLVDVAKEDVEFLELDCFYPGSCEEDLIYGLDQASNNSEALRLAAQQFDEFQTRMKKRKP